jgi:hypothetical protein
MTDKLKTICNFCYGPDPASEAELARIKLEANGIRCFLDGKNFIATYWLMSGVNRGIKLQVSESDAESALEILGIDKHKEGDIGSEPINPPCPKCGGNSVEYEKFSQKLFYLGILLLRFPLPFLKKTYKCANCGETWK